MIFIEFLLLYLFIGFLFGIAITWAIGEIEQCKIEDYHDKFKLFMVLFYIVLWPFCLVMSIRAILRYRKITDEQFKTEMTETIDVFSEINSIFEEDP